MEKANVYAGFVNTLRNYLLTLSLTLSFIFLSQSVSFAAAPSNGAWTTVGSMASRRVLATSTLLQNGKVLIAGGRASYSESLLSSTELYDPTTQTWSTTGNLNTQRVGNHILPYMVTLQNGKALIVGGADADDNALGSAELYDPTTGVWSYTGNLNTSRRETGVVLLNDGRVLAAGGVTGAASGTILTSSELYDPSTGTWSYAANDLAIQRDAPTLTKLQNGKVLLVGGNQADATCTSSAEIFDPTTNTWSSAGTMPWGAVGITTTLLSDGRVFAAGGDCQSTSAFPNTAIYNPTTNSWTATASVPVNPSISSLMSFLLNNGKVLVRSGSSNAGTNPGTQPPSDEIYDPATNSWTTTNLTVGDNENGTYTQLANGDVLLAGGWNCDPSNPSCTLNSTELFTVPSTTVTFDDISPVSPLNGTYAGITWGTGVWDVDGAIATDTTNSISFHSSSVTSGSFSFASPSVLLSTGIYSNSNQTALITLSCSGNNPVSMQVAPNTHVTLTTNWVTPCTTVTVTSSNGWNTNLDNLVYSSTQNPGVTPNPTPTPPPGTTGGYTTQGALLDTGDANNMNGSKFTTNGTGGAATSMSVFVGNVDSGTHNKYQMAIYTDTSGHPGTLVAKTGTGTLTPLSWNTLSITATLSANTTYWLMYNTNATTSTNYLNNMYFDTGASGIAAYASRNYGTWPNTFPTATLDNTLFSIYVSY